jgi:hypothetical protein
MKAAQELKQKAAPLHILVNNAGEHQLSWPVVLIQDVHAVHCLVEVSSQSTYPLVCAYAGSFYPGPFRLVGTCACVIACVHVWKLHPASNIGLRMGHCQTRSPTAKGACTGADSIMIPDSFRPLMAWSRPWPSTTTHMHS